MSRLEPHAETDRPEPTGRSRQVRTWVVDFEDESEPGSSGSSPLIVRTLRIVLSHVRVFRTVTGSVLLIFLAGALWTWWHQTYIAEAIVKPGDLYPTYETILKRYDHLLAVSKELKLFQRLNFPDTPQGQADLVASLRHNITVDYPRPPITAQPGPPALPPTFQISVKHGDRTVALQVCEALLARLQRERPEGGGVVTASMVLRNSPNTFYFEKYLFAPRVVKDVARRLDISKSFASQDDTEAGNWVRSVVQLGKPDLSNPYFVLSARGQNREEVLGRVRRLFELLSDWPVQEFQALTGYKTLARAALYPAVDQKYYKEYVYSQRCLLPIVREQRLLEHYKVPSETAALRYLSDNTRFGQDGQYTTIEVADARPEVALRILQSITASLGKWVAELPASMDRVIRFSDRVEYLAKLPDAKVNSNLPVSMLAELTNPSGVAVLRFLDPPHIVDSGPTKEAFEVIAEPHIDAEQRTLLEVLAPPYLNSLATAQSNRLWLLLLALGVITAPVLGVVASWSAEWWQTHGGEITGSSGNL